MMHLVAFGSRGGCGNLQMSKGARKGKAEEESSKELHSRGSWRAGKKRCGAQRLKEITE